MHCSVALTSHARCDVLPCALMRCCTAKGPPNSYLVLLQVLETSCNGSALARPLLQALRPGRRPPSGTLHNRTSISLQRWQAALHSSCCRGLLSARTRRTVPHVDGATAPRGRMRHQKPRRAWLAMVRCMRQQGCIKLMAVHMRHCGRQASMLPATAHALARAHRLVPTAQVCAARMSLSSVRWWHKRKQSARVTGINGDIAMPVNRQRNEAG